MIDFNIGKCPKCGHTAELMYSNNPLEVTPICFNCIRTQLDASNLDQVDFFCRTYNLPLNADLWITLYEQYKQDTFRQYTSLILEDKTLEPNLYYSSSTKDLWGRVNKEWEKCRSLTEILQKIKPIQDSYTTRGQLKWGDQYTFQDIIRLDSMYTRTLKANNITNPMQKEAVKTLCKLQLQLDEAIRIGDSKGIKDYSSAWGTFAKQADLENMIAETKTSDITTFAEAGEYLEKTGFVPTYDISVTRDEVDQCLKDIQESQRRTILESTSIQPLLEDLIKKQQESIETQKSKQATSDVTLEDLMSFNPDDATEVAVEADSDVTDLDFSEEKDTFEATTKVNHIETRELSGDKLKEEE